MGDNHNFYIRNGSNGKLETFKCLIIHTDFVDTTSESSSSSSDDQINDQIEKESQVKMRDKSNTNKRSGTDSVIITNTTSKRQNNKESKWLIL